MVIYQIYPRSFRDSNGDGIGDIPGIIEKLDYIQELGVDGIWLNPIFSSPQKDGGYDITDFCAIAPEYGTLDEFDELIKEAHGRNLKIVLDLVLNHTSDEHPWFQDSAAKRDSLLRDWYIWRDGKKPSGHQPPNNWKAMTGGPAWRYFPNTDQWVYFHFLPFQVDLNYRNPEVKEALFNIMRFWLDRGVDGFRLDLLHGLFKDDKFKDNPFSWRIFPTDYSTSVLFQSHIYDLNLPETVEFTRELRQVINEYQPPKILVGEVFGQMDRLAKYCLPESCLHMAFLFEFTSTPFSPQRYTAVIQKIERNFPDPYVPTYVLSNHDRMRFITRVDNDNSKAKLAATLQLTLRGVPFIYYGDEIGLRNADLPLKSAHDPIARKYSWVPIARIRRWGFGLNRDGCRTPMQWNAEENAGFSSNPQAKPWIPLSKDYREINVAQQQNDPDSLLNCYRKLLQLRRNHKALGEGSLKIVNPPGLERQCLAYSLSQGNQRLWVYLNFSRKAITINLPSKDLNLLFSTLPGRTSLSKPDGPISLSPLEGIILADIIDNSSFR